MFLPPADFYIPSTADRSLSAIDLGQSSCEEDEVLGRMFLPPRDFYIPSSLDTAMSRMSLGGRCGVCDLKESQDLESLVRFKAASDFLFIMKFVTKTTFPPS